MSRSAFAACQSILALVVCVGLTRTVRAAAWGNPEFGISLGASFLDDEGSNLGDNVGPWAEMRIAFSPIQNLPELRSGFGLQFSYQSEKVESPSFSTTADLYLITPEAQLSWRQPVGGHFYVEPGVGVGVMIGVLDFFGSEDDAEFSVRPFVRGGYETPTWTAGIEVGYQISSLDFGGGSDDVQNLNVGAFFTFKI